MKKTIPMSDTDFNKMIEIKKFNDMTEEELDVYTEIFIDQIKAQFRKKENNGIYWCPKCESLTAEVAIDEDETRALASCTNCRMAIIIIASEV